MFLLKSPPQLASLVSEPASGTGKVMEITTQNLLYLKLSQAV
jgi:hypothetical protein